MNKARKKFIFYAELAIFVLLTVLLSVINVINFSMVSDDADHLTEMISNNHGTMKKMKKNNNMEMKSGNNGRFGPMGPDAPDMSSSIRYFTYAFDKDGNAQKVEYMISAFSEEETESWARSLLNSSTGWTRGTYRFRVYEDNGHTLVTVIDQSRELLPSYRILIISSIGEVVILAISLLFLIMIGKKLFKPVEEADRKQKQFIAKLESQFKMPLTVINANTEILEKEKGSDEITKSINRQVRKMTGLVKELRELSVFEESDISISKTNISDIFNAVIDIDHKKFDEKGIELNQDIQPDVIFRGDEEGIRKVISELISNSVKFALSKATFSLKKQNERIKIVQMNDTDLPNGSCDQIFDRFTRLDNATDKEGAGLGLSYVKDIVKAHNGRTSAKVNNGIFTITIDL
ncbi:MAG: HAMP domain-containing histidine kinase [Clostridia bacterium]|nr:HAMP domain-containing histidine kinase [Clostridia bacterium]